MRDVDIVISRKVETWILIANFTNFTPGSHRRARKLTPTAKVLAFQNFEVLAVNGIGEVLTRQRQ